MKNKVVKKQEQPKLWDVTLVMILGYYDHEYIYPCLRMDDYEIEASCEQDAIRKAKELDKTSFSIWESYASEAGR